MQHHKAIPNVNDIAQVGSGHPGAATNSEPARADQVILIGARHVLLREGIKALVARGVTDARFVESEDGVSLMASACRWPAARMAIVESRLPHGSLLEMLEGLSARHAHLPLAVLTRAEVPEALRWLNRIDSIHAVLSEDASAHAIRETIETVMQGQRPRRHAPGLPPRCAYRSLTPRQYEIHRFLQEGMSNKLIASALEIRENTVKNHVSSILKALKVTNRTQAARLDLATE